MVEDDVKKDEWIRYKNDASPAIGPTIEVSFEVLVDGTWEEVTDLPAVETSEEEGDGLEVAWEMLGRYPEIKKAAEEFLAADAEHAASDRAVRQAESGRADL